MKNFCCYYYPLILLIVLDAKKFKEVFDSCKEKVAPTKNDVESEKLANELESLKVNDSGSTAGPSKLSAKELEDKESTKENSTDNIPETQVESKTETSDKQEEQD